MRIGLIVTSIGDFGHKDFYNRQEAGLAKALDALFDEVKIYKLIPIRQKGGIELIDGCIHASLQLIPAKSFGTNGRIKTNILDKSLDALIYFSDTQFAVPRIYRWAYRNHVKFFPYIGVIESHSRNKWKRRITDFLFCRNLCIYKRNICLVKTPIVREKLRRLKVERTIVAPAGLDVSLLKTDYKDYNIKDLKKKYNYQENDKVLLFIGRLVEEKQPERMIKLFIELEKMDRDYRLLMIGSGPFEKRIEQLIKISGKTEKICQINCIPNVDIWELYRIADVFINLNQAEIFGMSILEAMYYECKVVAWKAPGPNFIIEDGLSGYLVENDTDAVQKIINYNEEVGLYAHKRVMSCFTWMNTAAIIKNLLEKSELL